MRNADSPNGGFSSATIETTADLEEEEEEDDRFLSEDLIAFYRGNDVKEFAFDKPMKRQDDDDAGDWLIDWLIDLLIDWLFVRFIDSG